jgi:outer membrane protein assembly factor BamB
MHRLAVSSAILLSTCAILLAIESAAADWPQWRGPERNGVAAESPELIRELPPLGLEPVWINSEGATQGRNEGWSSPIVADGRVYLWSHCHDHSPQAKDKKDPRVERLTCLDAASGKMLWETVLPSRKAKFQQSGTPALHRGRVYVLGAGLMARCFDATSGEEVWSQQLPGDVNEECWQSSFLVTDDAAVVFAGRLAALDPQTGRLLWEGTDTVNEGVYGSPVEVQRDGESLVIAHIGRGETIAVDAASGKECWREKTDATNSTPLVAGDRLITFGHSRQAGVRAYKIGEDGLELLWKNQTISDPGSSPVVIDDHLYVQGERRLAAISLSDGTTAWSTELDMNQPRYTSLVAADGKVIYAFDRLFAFAASPEEFRLLYNGRVDRQGRVAEEETFRRSFKVSTDGSPLERQEEVDDLWRKEIENAGPIHCTSPALSDGRLYLRLKQGVACYDLRK